MKTLLQYRIMDGTLVAVFGFPWQYITLAAVILCFSCGYGGSAAQPSALDFLLEGAGRIAAIVLPSHGEVASFLKRQELAASSGLCVRASELASVC